VSTDIVPSIIEFFDAQRKIWLDSGGQVNRLPPADQAELIAKVSSIGVDLSASKPDLNAAVKTAFATAAKYK
ncbi:MAG: hypothetical protein WBE84_09045, partial [Xanthobacteraceae bacterium]